jgi:valyl-tRNA synthetase
MIEKTYNVSELEPRIYRAWEEAQAFRAGRPERRGETPYCIVIPPPNVTGSLHMGHALNNTLQDILVRFERMRGRDVLWQPGTDHAGIATQAVVERQLMERQLPDRRAMGRDAFIKRVWEWKEESGGTITRQLERLGASCDWSRERFTMDEGLSRAVVKVFVELFRAGLIYRDKRLVHWDPKLLTALADIEVQPVEVAGHLWYLRYPLEGQGETSIVVATTRPETMLGDTAVAVHPDDERYKHLLGRRVMLPLVGRRIPIIADAYSDPEKGTGAVKVTPAHDFNDFEVGKRHNLPMINIFDPEARLDLEGNAAFLDDVPHSRELAETLAMHGMDRFAARKRIVARLEDKGLVERIEPHMHTVPHGQRSAAVVEPFLTDQWYVDARMLAQEAIRAVRDRRTSFVPKQWETTYFNWMENIQPWCISRQLWWGHQIPAWYAEDGRIFVAATEQEAVAEAQAHYGRAVSLKRDGDVLDTWFSSALWPFSTLGWPDQTPELRRYYPTNVLVTGFDIIFFWVARMMMMGLHFLGQVPFRQVYIHALVRDERGQKMSKSKGNIIDPLHLIDEYGADALRFTLAAMAAQGRDIKLSTSRVEGYRNFATKLWNAARFAELNGCIRDDAFDPARAGETLNRWIIHETAKSAGEVTAALEDFKFNEAAGVLYWFVWNVFCDWYLEFAKPVLLGPDGPAKAETRATTAWALDRILKLLHPFMPFITEELWRLTGLIGRPRESLLILAPWPERRWEDAAAEAEIGWVIDLVTEIRSLRAEMNVPPASQMSLALVAPSAETWRRTQLWDPFIKRLGRVSAIERADMPPAGAVQLVIRGETVAFPLAGLVDLGVERARLEKELAKVSADIDRVDAKLANADFVRRAPEEVVESEREKREQAGVRREKLAEALQRISGLDALSPSA